MSRFGFIVRSILGSRKLRTISVSEVAARLGDDGFFVMDCNPSRRWARGHVPGARNLDPADYTVADLPPDKNATLVFYCSDPSCGASRFAALRAQEMGYTNTYVMPEGISGWLQAGLPVEQK